MAVLIIAADQTGTREVVCAKPEARSKFTVRPACAVADSGMRKCNGPGGPMKSQKERQETRDE